MFNIIQSLVLGKVGHSRSKKNIIAENVWLGRLNISALVDYIYDAPLNTLLACFLIVLPKQLVVSSESIQTQDLALELQHRVLMQNPCCCHQQLLAPDHNLQQLPTCPVKDATMRTEDDTFLQFPRNHGLNHGLSHHSKHI